LNKRYVKQYSFWRRNLFHNFLFCQIPSVSSEELALLVSSVENCPEFAATVTAFSYILLPMQDKNGKRILLAALSYTLCRI